MIRTDTLNAERHVLGDISHDLLQHTDTNTYKVDAGTKNPLIE